MEPIKTTKHGSFTVTIEWDDTNKYYVVTRKSKKSLYQERYPAGKMQRAFDTFAIFNMNRKHIDRTLYHQYA
jgi:hypothetical protein